MCSVSVTSIKKKEKKKSETHRFRNGMYDSGEADCIIQFLLYTHTKRLIHKSKRMNNGAVGSEVTCSRSYFCCSILFLSSSSTLLIWMKRSFCNAHNLARGHFQKFPIWQTGDLFSAVPPLFSIHITSTVFSELRVMCGGVQLQNNTSRSALWVANIVAYLLILHSFNMKSFGKPARQEFISHTHLYTDNVKMLYWGEKKKSLKKPNNNLLY